jgi:hypothetical protein
MEDGNPKGGGGEEKMKYRSSRLLAASSESLCLAAHLSTFEHIPVYACHFADPHSFCDLLSDKKMPFSFLILSQLGIESRVAPGARAV